MGKNLMGSFTYGNTEFGFLAPGSREQQFLERMPRDVHDLRDGLAEFGAYAIQRDRLQLRAIQEHAESSIAVFREGQREQTQAIEEQTRAIEEGQREVATVFREAAYQLECVDEHIQDGFSDVSRGIAALEATFAFHLDEMRFTLSSIDDSLAELIRIAREPGKTRSTELVSEGVKAMLSGHLEDADACLSEALATSRTNFSVHTNLGYLYLRKGDADKALLHFQKASDYHPDSARDATRVFALRNLARCHYVRHEFAQACSLLSKAINIQERHGDVDPRDTYQSGVYRVCAGDHDQAVKILTALCEHHPQFYASVCLDPEIEEIRNKLLPKLSVLIVTKLQDIRKKLGGMKDRLADIEKSATNTERNVIVRFRDAVEKCVKKASSETLVDLTVAEKCLVHLSVAFQAHEDERNGLAQVRPRIAMRLKAIEQEIVRLSKLELDVFAQTLSKIAHLLGKSKTQAEAESLEEVQAVEETLNYIESALASIDMPDLREDLRKRDDLLQECNTLENTTPPKLKEFWAQPLFWILFLPVLLPLLYFLAVLLIGLWNDIEKYWPSAERDIFEIANNMLIILIISVVGVVIIGFFAGLAFGLAIVIQNVSMRLSKANRDSAIRHLEGRRTELQRELYPLQDRLREWCTQVESDVSEYLNKGYSSLNGTFLQNHHDKESLQKRRDTELDEAFHTFEFKG